MARKLPARGRELRGGGFAALSIEIPEGEAARRAAELKTKGHLLCRCPFVLACVGKRDADFANQSRPQGGIPNRSPVKRVRFGSEEQQNERAMSFAMK